MTTIINTTPHDIFIYREDMPTRIIPKSNLSIRINFDTVDGVPIDGIPIKVSCTAMPMYLPPVSEDTFYVVSSIVKNCFPNRDDFLVPFDFVRDENGAIIGCRALAR